jgi:hypothetical protein
MSELKSFNLSNQALGAVMMALQKSLLEQSDIVPVLKNMDFVPTDDGLVVRNPPLVKVGADGLIVSDSTEEETE